MGILAVLTKTKTQKFKTHFLHKNQRKTHKKPQNNVRSRKTHQPHDGTWGIDT